MLKTPNSYISHVCTGPLKFMVFENGNLFQLCHMSQPESYSIQREVENLLPKAECDDEFEVDVTMTEEMDNDEDVPHGLVRCANPRRLDSLRGKTFQVTPRQYGVNPWADKVEIKFV